MLGDLNEHGRSLNLDIIRDKVESELYIVVRIRQSGTVDLQDQD